MSGVEGDKVVCVTGASGFIASWVVKFLLLRGYTVHATVRNLGDPNKVDHLLALEGAKERLRLFKASLIEEGSFDAAIKGCVGVFHVATPIILGCDDHSQEIEDLLNLTVGTMNVLNSCAKSGSVKRVVLTSSIAAMVVNDRPISSHTTEVDETWWSDPQICQNKKRWYAASKVMAEEAAWKYAKENDIDLVCICPGWTIGPMLQPSVYGSVGVIYNLIGVDTYSNIAYAWINVKDVALAHIQAFEIQSANGRYALAERLVSISDTIKMLRESYPSLQLPTKCVECQPYLPECKFSKKRAESLGIEFIPFEISLKETIECFKEKKWITY